MIKPYYEDSAVKIFHGDCREILPSLPPVDLVLTDPPYGIELDTDYRRFKTGSPSRLWDSVAGDAEEFDPSVWLKFDKVILWGANYYSHKLPRAKWIVWNKIDEGVSRVLADGEMAWHNCPGQTVRIFNHFWTGCYRKGEMRQPVLHPTQKPLALMQFCIGIALEGEEGVILDPFMGSGTSLRAAKDLGRKAIGIEIEEKYCEIAARRMGQEVLELEWPTAMTPLETGS